MRLSKGRIVDLVVSVKTIANQINQNALAELLPELGCSLKRVHDRLRIVTIDVHYRASKALGQITEGVVKRAHILHKTRDENIASKPAVARAAAHARVSCEPNLVVDHDMHGAAAAVVTQFAETHRLVHDSLAGKGGVSVENNWNSAAFGGVFGVELTCNGFTCC